MNKIELDAAHIKVAEIDEKEAEQLDLPTSPEAAKTRMENINKIIQEVSTPNAKTCLDLRANVSESRL